jgi:hypothetical protein
VWIIAQSQFHVNEENVDGAVFHWFEHRNQNGLLSPDVQSCFHEEGPMF